MTDAEDPAVRGRILPPLLFLVAACAILWIILREFSGAHPELTESPLSPRATSQGTRFTRLRAHETGISFANELRRNNSYTYLTNGAGLAVGDYDRDGLPDLYFVSQDGPNRLYRQVAPFRFEDVTERAGNVDGGQAWGTGASFADVDGDGLLDLYVCCMEAPNKLYRNLGHGTFEECAERFGLARSGATMMAAFCDYDRDGDLDVYLLANRALHAGLGLTPEVLSGITPPSETRRKPAELVPDPRAAAELQRFYVDNAGLEGGAIPPELREHFFSYHGRLYMAGQPDVLLRNDGDRFRDVTTGAGIADHGMGLSATWWDYDRDGWPDLYVANDLESPDVLWHNERNGTFRDVTREAMPHTAYYGMGSDAADIDNDGWIDLLVADMSPTTHKQAKIQMGDMNPQRDFLIHSDPQQYMRNVLYHNTGAGVFRTVERMAGLSSTDWTWSVLFGDLDNDGYQDLLATNGIARFDMNPDIGIAVRKLWHAGQRQQAIDLIHNIPRVPERNHVLRNEGGLHFTGVAKDWGLDLLAVSQGAALVDLDRDGDLDVVVTNLGEECAVFRNDGEGGHAVEVSLEGGGMNRFGIGARVEVETAKGRFVRECWPSRGYLSGQEPRLCFGLGDADRIERLVVRWPSGRVQEFGGLAADRCYSIREPQGPARRFAPPAPRSPALFGAIPDGPRAAHRENEFDDYADQPLLPHLQSRFGPGVAVGDADGDGLDDLFLGGAAGQPGTLLLRDGNAWREVEGPWRDDRACEDMGVLWFDFDGDGDQDLLVTSGGPEHREGSDELRDRLYRNDKNLRFSRSDALPAPAESSGMAAAADFDGDGDLDLFVAGRMVPGAYPDAPPSRLYQNDGGRFVDVGAEIAPALADAGLVTAALWSDADGDGRVDLLLAAHWQPLRWLRNEGGRLVDRTEEAGLALDTGWWNSLAAIDVDEDGDLDYVAGNFGTNTKYKASREHPAGLLVADFDGNGTRDLVETKFEGENLLPVRGRSCSSQAMPFLAEKFETYERFASATLPEIYPRDKLEKARSLRATRLESVLLRNDGRGRFAIEPLPGDAQIAPIFGLCVADFDGDGHDDVGAATNFYSPEPETGRFDGGLGLLLRGDGKTLVASPPASSGLLSATDQKGAATADLDKDGAPDLLLAVNDGEMLARRTTSTAARVRVRLAGPPGNPTGIGSLVTARLRDGRSTIHEIHAGEGYLSQSSAVLSLSALVQRVEVRWPDGSKTMADVPDGAREVVLRRE
ncbi:MAG: VCBS repeat-containing protein [Planctomycetota bacterium]